MACKITKTVEHRLITQEEFKRQKTAPEYASYRQIAKRLNFLLIFDGSGKMFAENALETEWSKEDVDNFIKSSDCSKEIDEVADKYGKYPQDKQDLFVVGNKMRNNFFDGYPGLHDRIEREQKYAHDHGYCRSIFGDTRHLIEVMLQGQDDKRNASKMLSNLDKVASNYRAQNYESCIRGKAMRQMKTWLKENGYKTMIFNEVHDSVDFMLYKPELKNVISHAKHIFERRVPEFEDTWVPLSVDIEISDLNKGQYYKGGSSPESYGIKWDDLEFEDPDPFGVELTEQYELDYLKKRQEYWNKKGEKDPLEDRVTEYIKKAAC